MFRAGINPIEVLLWSRTKTLEEVRVALERFRTHQEFNLKLVSTTEETGPVKAGHHVHFDDEPEKMINCPEKNCSFSAPLPKHYGISCFLGKGFPIKWVGGVPLVH